MKRDETERMAALYRAGYSCGEIGKIHELSRQQVHVRLVRAGVQMRSRPRKEAEPSADSAPNAE